MQFVLVDLVKILHQRDQQVPFIAAEVLDFCVEKQERRCSLLFVSTANGEQVTGVFSDQHAEYLDVTGV